MVSTSLQIERELSEIAYPINSIAENVPQDQRTERVATLRKPITELVIDWLRWCHQEVQSGNKPFLDQAEKWSQVKRIARELVLEPIRYQPLRKISRLMKDYRQYMADASLVDTSSQEHPLHHTIDKLDKAKTQEYSLGWHMAQGAIGRHREKINLSHSHSCPSKKTNIRFMKAVLRTLEDVNIAFDNYYLQQWKNGFLKSFFNEHLEKLKYTIEVGPNGHIRDTARTIADIIGMATYNSLSIPESVRIATALIRNTTPGTSLTHLENLSNTIEGFWGPYGLSGCVMSHALSKTGQQEPLVQDPKKGSYCVHPFLFDFVNQQLPEHYEELYHRGCQFRFPIKGQSHSAIRMIGELFLERLQLHLRNRWF